MGCHELLQGWCWGIRQLRWRLATNASSLQSPMSCSHTQTLVWCAMWLVLVLQQGTFGSVRRCTDSATGQPYAVKVIPKRSPDGKDRSAFIAREVHMWRMLAVLSPRVVGLHAAYQDSNNIFLVQELLLDDLQKVLDEQVSKTQMGGMSGANRRAGGSSATGQRVRHVDATLQ